MSRKYTKRMKRQNAAQRNLLEKLVKEHGQWVKDREAAFREISSYDPVDGDQPCTDKEMGDYDEYDTDFAFDARDAFTDFATEARKVLKMETV